jgi:GntR family transcriptional repressor for pyruvate dehydrogenase complex
MEETQESATFPSFKRGNLVEMVFENLRKNILTGKFKDGDLLPTQETLAQKFGVSRTVMREALNKLSSLGLVESHQGRGTFVRSPNARTVMEPMFTALLLDETATCELMEARYYLERIIVRLAAKHINAQQIQALQEIVERMDQHFHNGDLEGFSEGDLAFHLKLAEISKNGILNRISEVIREMLSKFLESFNRIPGAAGRANDYHKKICQAVIQKDPDKAESEMQQHLLDVTNALREEYKFNVEL